MNEYYNKLQHVKDKITSYLTEIFKVYGNELLLRLEEYNLLTSPNNCIETSTATGYIMEEFITSKLSIYTNTHNNKEDIKIKKLTKSTAKSSYDCSTTYKNTLFLINAKAEKIGNSNDAVASISSLHNDYVVTKPEQEKSYMIIKVQYSFGTSKADKQRKVLIKGIEAYFLEEMDFSNGHIQDKRNWSENYNANSGRLQASKTWRKEHRVKPEDMSYERTRKSIDDIFNSNEKK